MQLTVDPFLRLYPGPWKSRYGDEVSVLLTESPPDWRDRLDLLIGALDAHVHPISAPAWPVAAAAIAGVAWTIVGAVALGQPAPADWPGYLEETLPMLAASVPLVVLAGVGASTRLGDRNPALARAGRPLIVLAGILWTALLVAAATRIGADATLAIAATGMGAGLLLVGIALIGQGDALTGAALLAAGLCLLAPATWAQTAFGVALVALAASMRADPRPARVPPVVLR